MSSRVAKEMNLSLLEYSMFFLHNQSRFVCDSGSMSATVGECFRSYLTHVITLMLYQFIATMNEKVVKQMYLSLLEYIHALNAQRIRQWEYVCNSGWVQFGSENDGNDRSNTCHYMIIS